MSTQESEMNFYSPLAMRVRSLLFSCFLFVLRRIENFVQNVLDYVWGQLPFSPRSPSAKKPKFKLLRFLRWLWRLPLVVLYYIYVYPFVFIARNFLQMALRVVDLFMEQSGKLNNLSSQVTDIQAKVHQLVSLVLSSKLSEFIPFCANLVLEVLTPYDNRACCLDLDRSGSLEELSELLAYEEFDDEEEDESLDNVSENNHHFNKSLLMMHCYVPTKPFKATVRRVTQAAPKAESVALVTTSSGVVKKAERRKRRPARASPTDCMMSTYDLLGGDSPASFPATPFSRAYVMNKSSEKVVSVMFAARDKLRLEAQSVSRDEYSRLVAREAKTSGQLAQFDPNLSSAGIALSCGNHCAIKVGKGLCCCCRSMVPVGSNAFVYLEFSITVSSAQVPTLGVGLAPLDCPLNVMVGSWPKSVGLYTDGQILIGSHWFQGASGDKMVAGSTVGMLVHISELNVDSPIARLRADSKFSALRSPTMGTRLAPLMESDCSVSGKQEGVGIADLGAGAAREGGSGDETPVAAPYECSVEPLASGRSREGSGNELLKSALLSSSGKDGGPPTHLRLMMPLPVKATAAATTAQMSLQFNINGKVMAYPSEVRTTVTDIPTGGVAGAAATPLYPTVSIFSEDTRVWCRFCCEDVVYRSRKAIGAPEGVRVYCLDGSLLIRETD